MKDIEIKTVTDDEGNKYKEITINKGLQAIEAALDIIESHYVDYTKTKNQQSLDAALHAVSILFGRPHHESDDSR